MSICICCLYVCVNTWTIKYFPIKNACLCLYNMFASTYTYIHLWYSIISCVVRMTFKWREKLLYIYFLYDTCTHGDWILTISTPFWKFYFSYSTCFKVASQYLENGVFVLLILWSYFMLYSIYTININFVIYFHFWLKEKTIKMYFKWLVERK